jgi:hypothetical protein
MTLDSPSETHGRARSPVSQLPHSCLAPNPDSIALVFTPVQLSLGLTAGAFSLPHCQIRRVLPQMLPRADQKENGFSRSDAKRLN